MTFETRFDLIEAMRHDARDGVIDLDRHLARLKASADALGFAFDRHNARNELQAASFGAGDARVRLFLARSGAMAVEVQPLPDAPAEPVTVVLAPLPAAPDDPRLRHRTTDTGLHAEARRHAFETVYIDAEGLLVGGSFTSVFVERDGILLTPERGRGMLRARLIESGKAREAELRPEDLQGGFLLGNSVRGLLRAVLAAG